MNNFHELHFNVIDIDLNQKLIEGGSEIDLKTAIEIAFPKSDKKNIFGFKKIGDDLRIRKLPNF